MRSRLKRSLEIGLVRSGLAELWRRVSGKDAVVLAYHNVVPEGDRPLGDISLHLPLPSFLAQVDLLSENCTIVPLQELIVAVRHEGKPLAAITFDDAYRGALELGVPELIKRELPATVFVAPGLLGCEGFWWDQVADPSSGAVPPEFRRAAFRDFGGRQERILETARSLGWKWGPMPDLYRPASEGAVDALALHPLVTLGSHTWSHVHLPSVPAAEAEAEFRRSRQWLEDRSVPNPILLSYPYGAYPEGMETSLLEAGYEAGFLIQGGAMRLRDVTAGRMVLPRVNVPRGLSPNGLRARISGAWPG
jgi:peptidoglycan/xylan/chitin deacetylase (PgdA/CDA1 family)